MHKILSWDLLQWLESLPIASHCLRKIAIFVDLIRRRSVWSLRTVLSQCRVNVSLEKLHKHMWFKYYTQRGVLEYEWREHKYTFRDSPARKSHLGVRWITSSLTERYKNDLQEARKISYGGHRDLALANRSSLVTTILPPTGSHSPLHGS